MKRIKDVVAERGASLMRDPARCNSLDFENIICIYIYLFYTYYSLKSNCFFLFIISIK